MSIVQALVLLGARPARSRVPREETSSLKCRNERFLATLEDDSNSDVDADDQSSRTSSRQFCSAIWGRVHGMTYELLSDTPSGDDGAPSASSRSEISLAIA